MAFQLSPGVNVSEIDLTTVVPSVLTTAGAFAGTFSWGPANKVVLVDNEITLKKTFGEPDSNSAISFFTSANFLSYGNNLSIVRAVASTGNNSVDGANTVQILNEDDYQYNYLNLTESNFGAVIARYPGVLGNSLKVSICANTSLFSSWDYKSYFTSAPGTSEYVAAAGGSNDEMHIIVIDEDGQFTGTAGTVLETYPFVSKASDAINANDGSSNHYKQVIFQKSKYIYAMNPMGYGDALNTWNKPASGRTFANLPIIFETSLENGNDDLPQDGDIQQAYDLFANKETIDISLVLTGNASTTVQQYVIDNVVSVRKDCVAFISPPASAVINNSGNETSDIDDWLIALGRKSSYVVADSGWKYQFDKYNNVYRWLPLNADVAGLCVNTDTVRDPWFSPAGFNRGAVKNAIKLAWNPSKTFRDALYASGVNPVVSFPGQGIVLFGDKTLQSKPSAFDRINVRRLFIVLEKTIARAAQFSLFEFNDEFTRAQFTALVTPFLRDIQGRRGITDFKVVCDTTNNTPNVIDSNQFVGDIYIKPARSINFIQLNFVAVGTGVDFTTVVGAA
jgi:hypothetical protein